MKSLLNKIIDYFFEKKRVKKKHKQLTNKELINALSLGKLFIACIKSRNNNFASRMITKFSGPYSHVVAVWNSLNSVGNIGGDRCKALIRKMIDYYSDTTYLHCPKIIVLASADENGMNYFDISEYQNREMTIFQIDTDKADDIIHEFLSEKVMNMNYDYTGLVGQIFRKLGKWFYSLFDDERAYYCSEQAEIFKRHGVKIADHDEPTPTEIFNYCLKHYSIVYSNI